MPGQSVGPQVLILLRHQGGQGQAHQLFPVTGEDLAGHIIAPGNDAPGVQLNDAVEGIIQQHLQMGGVPPLGVGGKTHAAGVAQAGAQGVLRTLKKQGALAQAAAAGVDEVAAQNYVHPVGYRLLHPLLGLVHAGHKVSVQFNAHDFLKALDLPHHVGDGHHTHPGTLRPRDQVLGPVEQQTDLQAGQPDLHHRQIGVGLQNGRLTAPGHQDIRPQSPALLHLLQNVLGGHRLVQNDLHPQLPGNTSRRLHHLRSGKKQRKFRHSSSSFCTLLSSYRIAARL